MPLLAFLWLTSQTIPEIKIFDGTLEPMFNAALEGSQLHQRLQPWNRTQDRSKTPESHR